ncbi:MAG: ribosome maturation factor RimP [Deltaproteobacteria bacterium]|nr:ribosome maturation factor RimP [Deltaproteobacteria bacterium]
MRLAAFIDEVKALIEPVIKEEGAALYDVVWTKEQGRNVLRVMLDPEKGAAGLGDCARVSRAIEDLLIVHDVVPGSYDLEVSSPGLNRPLLTPAHFERVLGKMIRVKTEFPIDGRQNYKGVLKKIEGEQFLVDVDKKEHRIPFDQVDKANLEYFE